MDDRGPRGSSGYGYGESRPPESDTRGYWTPSTPGGPGFRGGKSPESYTQHQDMDLDDRDVFHGGPSKRLTAHVAPVPGRSMTPERSDPRYLAGPSSRRVEDEDVNLYGHAIKKEQRWEERREVKYQPPGPPYADYERRGSLNRRPMTYPEDQYDIKPMNRRPPSPPRYGNRSGEPLPPMRMAASGENNDIDAGRRSARVIHEENKNYSTELYPARGTAVRQEEKPRVAVYEMNKIPRKTRQEEEQELDEDAKLMHLRSEHAKIELRVGQLKLLIDRTVEKENELKRINKGRTMADNKEFCDNKKLQMDAQKKYEDALKQLREKEVALNAILSAQARRAAAFNESNDNSQDADGVAPQKQNTMFSTDYLGEQREDREEELESAARIEFFDGGDHWCEPCQDVFVDTVKQYLEHLHADDHFKNIPPNKPVPWPITRRTKNYDEDRQMAALKGSQFMIPCKAFYCMICRVFCGDKEAAEEHLFSVSHNKINTKFLISKPEFEHLYNKDKNAARAKAQASIRAKKREAEEKRRKEEEEARRRMEEEIKRKEKEARDKSIADIKNIKILSEKRIEKSKIGGRSSRERSIDKKRKNLSSSSSSSSSRDSSPDIEEIKPNPLDDVKLKKKCIVSIPKEEFIRAKKAYGKLTLVVTTGASSSTSDEIKPKLESPSDSVDSSKEPRPTNESDNSKSHSSTPSAKDDDTSNEPKKSKVSADFDDDDDNDKNSFNLSSVMPTSSLEPDDNAVTSPDSVSASKAEQVVSSSEVTTEKLIAKVSPKKPVITNFDAICNALEDDEDSSEDKKVAHQKSPVKIEPSPTKQGCSPLKSADQVTTPSEGVITGKDVELRTVEPMEVESSKADSSQGDSERYVPSGHSFPQLSLDDLTKSPSYDDV